MVMTGVCVDNLVIKCFADDKDNVWHGIRVRFIFVAFGFDGHASSMQLNGGLRSILLNLFDFLNESIMFRRIGILI